MNLKIKANSRMFVVNVMVVETEWFNINKGFFQYNKYHKDETNKIKQLPK